MRLETRSYQFPLLLVFKLLLWNETFLTYVYFFFSCSNPQVAISIVKFLIDNFGVCNLFGLPNYEYYARLTSRVLKVENNWIFAYKYPLDMLTDSSKCPTAQDAVKLEELRSVNKHAERTRSLSFLPQVHERQTQRMKMRSEWFLTPEQLKVSRPYWHLRHLPESDINTREGSSTATGPATASAASTSRVAGAGAARPHLSSPSPTTTSGSTITSQDLVMESGIHKQFGDRFIPRTWPSSPDKTAANTADNTLQTLSSRELTTPSTDLSNERPTSSILSWEEMIKINNYNV